MKIKLLKYLSQFLQLRTRTMIRGKFVRFRLLPNVIALSEYGLNREPRAKKVIVSLTSFPQRMWQIHFTLCSLLNQTIKPDEIILWLGSEQFPGREQDIPKKVIKLQKYGITIKWCNDIKSYKKLVPALKEYPDDIIITADDDIYYLDNWLALLYEGYLNSPNCISCHRAARVTFDENNKLLPYKNWHNISEQVAPSYLNFLTTGGGVLFPPNLQ